MTIRVKEDSLPIGIQGGSPALECFEGKVRVMGDPDGPGGTITVQDGDGENSVFVTGTVWNPRTEQMEIKCVPFTGSITLSEGESITLANRDFNLKHARYLELKGTTPKGYQAEAPRKLKPGHMAVIRTYRDYHDPEWGGESVIEQVFHILPGSQWPLDTDTFVNVTTDGSVEIVKAPQGSDLPPCVQTLMEGDYVTQATIDQKGPLTVIVEPEAIGDTSEN